MNVSGSRKKGISPVLATVILIAITIVAATSIAGFVFGLMGTFTNTATVSATSVSCSGTPEVCTLFATNPGVGSTSITGVCALSFGGSSYQGTAVMVAGNLNGGGTGKLTCTSNTALSHAASGSQVTGWFSVGNGANVLFSASAQ